MHRNDHHRRLFVCFAPTVIVAGSLASLIEDVAIAQERVQRSTADVRERPPDELDRPRNKERWTHRGYEIKTDKFIVVANTRVEDARVRAGTHRSSARADPLPRSRASRCA